MDPSLAEFLAEKEIVTIVPNFAQGKVYLISGDVGPFVPSIPIKVPLWMAVNLRQREMCRILPPKWMDIELLEAKKQEEMDNRYFTLMPSQHYMEITQMLLDVAASDIPRADEIKTLIKDLWDTRLAKLRSSIDAFLKSNQTFAQLNHLTSLEINMVRPFLPSALNHLHRLRQGLTAVVDRQTRDT